MYVCLCTSLSEINWNKKGTLQRDERKIVVEIYKKSYE